METPPGGRPTRHVVSRKGSRVAYASYEYREPPRRGGRSGCRQCCCGCAAATFVASLLLFGMVMGLALRDPRRAPEVQARREAARALWSAPSSERAPEAEALRSRMERVAERAAEQSGSDGAHLYDVTVTEAEANALLATDPEIRRALESHGVHQMTLLFEQGRILIDGKVTYRGMTLDVRGDAVPSVRADGTLDVRVENAKASGFPMPPSVLGEVERMLEDVLSQQDPSRGRIHSLTLSKGSLRLEAETRGEMPRLFAS